MKRIFVAIDISEDARRKVAQYIADLRGDIAGKVATWTHPEKLHLTLRFIGNCEEEELPKVIDATRAAAESIRPFTIKIVGTGVFPNKRKARVLWLGIDDKTDQMTKAVNIFDAAYNGELQSDREVFSPHLTIARIKDRVGGKELVNQHLNSNFEPVEFEVLEIVVYESQTLSTGSVYSVVSRHPLPVTKISR
jgi:2'-5' RNA ligase